MQTQGQRRGNGYPSEQLRSPAGVQLVVSQAAPHGQFRFEAHRHVRRRGRRQHHGAVAGLFELRRELARCLAVEADCFQLRAQMAQAVEIVGGRLADGGIEATLALAGGQHVPQAEAVREQARQALVVRESVEVFIDQRADQLPELIDVWLI